MRGKRPELRLNTILAGGWDWSQYSTTETLGGLKYLSLGVWKSVYLVRVRQLSLRAMTAHVFYQGEYPSAPLTDATAGAWEVRVTAHVAAGAHGAPRGAAFEASLQGLPAVRNATATLDRDLQPYESTNVTVTLVVPAHSVWLWWPNGVFAANGAKQPLYNVSLRGPGWADTRRVGFRTIALVTDDDSRPAALKGLSGSGELTLRYVVNGAMSIYARGSNAIPLDEFAGRADARALTLHLESAAAAGMNFLLIWGGVRPSFLPPFLRVFRAALPSSHSDGLDITFVRASSSTKRSTRPPTRWACCCITT